MQRRARRKEKEEDFLQYIGSGNDPPNGFTIKFINELIGKDS